MISNSGHDESWNYSGGSAGDQTGTEWEIRSWYNRPWNLVLRYPDRNVGKLIAELARQAANNNNIGYDQGQRVTFWYALKDAGYYPKNIKVKCEADCSSGVLSIVKAAGYIKGIQALKNVDPNGWTGSMRSQLAAAGFETLSSSKYLTSDAYLLPGDILLNEQSHTAINLDTGSKAGKNTGNSVRENVMLGQQWLNDYYGHFLDRVFGEQLVVDGEYGKKTRAAAISIWKDVCNRLYGFDLDIYSDYFGTMEKKAANEAALVEFGSSGTFPLICKLILSAEDYYHAKMNVDCGYDLCESIQKFEAGKGLTVDSSDPCKCAAGAEVWTKLFEFRR